MARILPLIVAVGLAIGGCWLCTHYIHAEVPQIAACLLCVAGAFGVAVGPRYLA